MNIVWGVLLLFLAILVGGLYLIVNDVAKKNWKRFTLVVIGLIVLMIATRYIVIDILPGL